MKFKLIYLLLPALFFAGCSSLPSSDEEDVEAPQVMEDNNQQRGFSLSFPSKDDWNVEDESEFKLVLSKQGESDDQAYKIQTLVVRLPSFANDEGFVNYIKKRVKKSQKRSRNKIIEGEAQIILADDKKCVQYNSKEKPANESPLLLELVSYTCIHTEKENTGVYFAYSKKHNEGNVEENILENAENIFNYLTLAPF